MLSSDRTVETVAWSDDRILKVDQLQYQLGQGPCVDAVWTDGVIVVPDLPGDQRWPLWAPEAAGLGVGSALNLYALEPREYGHTDVESARVIAAHASVVLAYARREQNLWRAIDARNLIGQAQGILMERYRVTPSAAFAILRRQSQNQNVKLAVLAEELVSTGQLAGLARGGRVVPTAVSFETTEWPARRTVRPAGPLVMRVGRVLGH